MLFEALLMALVAEMPVRAVAELVGEHDRCVWRLVHYYVDAARAREDLCRVERLGIDETSFRRGQDYVTLFADLDRCRCVFATPGRDADSVSRFVADLREHGGEPAQVREVCQDMSEPYLFGVLGKLLQGGVLRHRLADGGAVLQVLVGPGVDDLVEGAELGVPEGPARSERCRLGS